jgi:uncharacterized protein with von Willebrand factor type A (vWA) domain
VYPRSTPYPPELLARDRMFPLTLEGLDRGMRRLGH